MNRRTTEIKIRCEGTPAQYWTLKLFLDGELYAVRTSNQYSYILKVQQGWLNQSAPTFTQEWR